MDDRSLRGIQLASGQSTGRHGRPQQVEQRKMTFGKVRTFGEPVVHLRIDVHRVLRSPRRIHTLVPDTLQIRGQRTRPRTRDQHVSAELKIDRQQMHIFAAILNGLHTFVGRHICLRIGAKFKTSAPKIPLMIRNMACPKLCVWPDALPPTDSGPQQPACRQDHP